MLKNAVDNFINQVTSMMPGIQNVLIVIGAAILIFALVRHIAQRRRGNVSGVVQGFPWVSVLFAALLIAPGVILPGVAMLLDVVIAVFLRALEWASRTVG